jgi:hypothetical protein
VSYSSIERGHLTEHEDVRVLVEVLHCSHRARLLRPQDEEVRHVLRSPHMVLLHIPVLHLISQYREGGGVIGVICHIERGVIGVIYIHTDIQTLSSTLRFLAFAASLLYPFSMLWKSAMVALAVAVVCVLCAEYCVLSTKSGSLY